MNTQIKKWGSSYIFILPAEFMRFHNLKLGDWVNLDDIVKVKKVAENGSNKLKTALKRQDVNKKK